MMSLIYEHDRQGLPCSGNCRALAVFNQVFQRKTPIIKMMNVGGRAAGRKHSVAGA